jgi:hypothetical protein
MAGDLGQARNVDHGPDHASVCDELGWTPLGGWRDVAQTWPTRPEA